MLKINKQNYEYGAQPSVIRELYNYGLKRKRDIGEDRIFDFSIGNPNIPLPDYVVEALHECVINTDYKPHAYS
ncbi:MAG: pyridoxal phosphate-dependent aminotransferase, partial [Eggerthellaceae bacterium]|nr:pyridoxal phosphate-dependent aminotransferase [Eggerthellaceae bacterium]